MNEQDFLKKKVSNKSMLHYTEYVTLLPSASRQITFIVISKTKIKQANTF